MKIRILKGEAAYWWDVTWFDDPPYVARDYEDWVDVRLDEMAAHFAKGIRLCYR